MRAALAQLKGREVSRAGGGVAQGADDGLGAAAGRGQRWEGVWAAKQGVQGRGLVGGGGGGGLLERGLRWAGGGGGVVLCAGSTSSMNRPSLHKYVSKTVSVNDVLGDY